MTFVADKKIRIVIKSRCGHPFSQQINSSEFWPIKGGICHVFRHLGVQIMIMLVATQFLTHILINFQKKIKKRQKTMKTPKNVFLIYLHRFSIFNVISKELKFSKIFGTRSTFNA